MEEISTIGLDLAKTIFQVHGSDANGNAVVRKRLRRDQVLKFFAGLPRCVVAMEACASSHHWGREIGRIGHEVRLIAPAYVKPFVKRQKNDAADAEAIVVAAQRPEMRFVEPKSEEQQALTILFRARERLVRQRTELINALRAHLYEFGYSLPQKIRNLQRADVIVNDPGSELPALVREECRELLEQIAEKSARIAVRDKRIKALASESSGDRRLQTMPGIGPITALAVEAFAPNMTSFRRGRDFAAWLGLVPRQHSSGGKERLGRISKAGQSDIRRLLIIGAMSRLGWLGKRTIPDGSWLARMLTRKPRMLVAIALANKMARAIWAMLTKNEDYADPAKAAAA